MITGISVGVLEYAPCFAGLNPEAEKWLPGLMKELSFTRGEHILREGEPCPGLSEAK